MNTALQCLLHTPDVMNFFLGEFDLYRRFTPKDVWARGGGLLLEFSRLLFKMSLNQGAALAPTEFHAALGKHEPRFSGYE